MLPIYNYSIADLNSITAREVWEKMSREQFITAPGRAIFWGGPVTRPFMQNVPCQGQTSPLGWQSIADTEGHRWLSGAVATVSSGPSGGPSKDEQQVLWCRASRLFAEACSGPVVVLHFDHPDRRRAATFVDHELPALLENERVTTINGIAREDLAELYEQNYAALLQRKGINRDQVPTWQVAHELHRGATAGVLYELNRHALEAQRLVEPPPPPPPPPPKLEQGPRLHL